MRISEFRRLMVEQFGPARGPVIAQDHVFGVLDGRTADQALAAGVDPKSVWLAVCDTFEVPESLRYGLPDPTDRGPRGAGSRRRR